MSQRSLLNIFEKRSNMSPRMRALMPRPFQPMLWQEKNSLKTVYSIIILYSFVFF